jgi:hypothetical protein
VYTLRLVFVRFILVATDEKIRGWFNFLQKTGTADFTVLRYLFDTAGVDLRLGWVTAPLDT